MSEYETKNDVKKETESSVEGPVMRKADGPSSGKMASVQSAFGNLSGSSGSPLPGPIQRKFESSLGTDLSSVRVHTGSASQQAASAVSAKAFATGQDIHFNSGQYNPSSSSGQTLLAHEVAHTVQQSGGGSPQFKLNVSQPGDPLEVEADQAATAMVAGLTAKVSRGIVSGGIHRQEMKFEPDEIQANESTEDKMRRAANEREKGVRAIKVSDTIRLDSLSSVETASQAKACIQKVTKANSNMYVRQTALESEVSDLSGAHEWKEKDEANERLDRHNELQGKNDKVIATLEDMVDLIEGKSESKGTKHRPGHNLQLQVFSQLAQGARKDFARLEGVVAAFMDVHNMDMEGKTGHQIGTAVATGGEYSEKAKENEAALDGVKEKVADIQDNELSSLVHNFKNKHSEFESAGYSNKINTKLSDCAGKISEAQNLQVDLSMGVERPESEEQTAANAEVKKVEADLAAAKSGLGKLSTVGKLAVSVMTGPVGMSAAGMTAGLSEASALATAKEVADTTSQISQGVKDVSDVDVGKKVSEGITDAVAKAMTDYDSRIKSAKAKVKAANAKFEKAELKLNEDQINVAKTNVTAEFDKLSQICLEVEQKKAEMRAIVQKIDERQKTLQKRGQKVPDVAGMTRALGECTSYVEQAKAAIEQGEGAKDTAEEILARQKAVAGEMKEGSKQDRTADMSGERVWSRSKKQESYVDCETSPPYLLSEHPLSFRVRSNVLTKQYKNGEVVRTETTANTSTDVALKGVETALEELNGNMKVAKGFQTALKRSMNM